MKKNNIKGIKQVKGIKIFVGIRGYGGKRGKTNKNENMRKLVLCTIGVSGEKKKTYLLTFSPLRSSSNTFSALHVVDRNRSRGGNAPVLENAGTLPRMAKNISNTFTMITPYEKGENVRDRLVSSRLRVTDIVILLCTDF